MFYHKRLRNDSRTSQHIETYKHDLLCDLFEELIKLHKKKTYQNYDPVKLIFIKARKVWIDFIRSLEREAKRKGIVNLNELPDDYSSGDFHQDFECSNTVSLIREFLNPVDFNLLQLRAEGHTYKQILKLTNYTSEDAAKTRYYRIKNLVREHFRLSDL